jgi:hypothetical protein
MKKILSGLFFFAVLFTATLTAQSNLNWKFKDKFEKGFLKTNTLINSSFTGFNNAGEIDAFITKVKANPNVASCDIVSKTANSCDVKLKMKAVQNKPFYLSFANSIGVQYITINGERRSLDEIKRGNKK